MWGSVYLFALASSVTKIKNNYNITLKSLNVHYFKQEITLGYIVLRSFSAEHFQYYGFYSYSSINCWCFFYSVSLRRLRGPSVLSGLTD